ncbi:hypothetical protein [Pseudoruegeria sp. HB172150]|uniref:hypothetical protein n=1 Tax=Pseudoruegeria sp. HB172150 TaxID=2721164 RepID=UPI0015520260|nr:hypothetical protein [Pseudoruegeria sp. HB172150]
MKLQAFLLLIFATAAQPHGWYDPYCCSDRDCAHIRATAVAVDGAWIVSLKANDHPMLNSSVKYIIHFDDFRVRPSRDNYFHACISSKEGYLLCLYVPEGAF